MYDEETARAERELAALRAQLTDMAGHARRLEEELKTVRAGYETLREERDHYVHEAIRLGRLLFCTESDLASARSNRDAWQAKAERLGEQLEAERKGRAHLEEAAELLRNPDVVSGSGETSQRLRDWFRSDQQSTPAPAESAQPAPTKLEALANSWWVESVKNDTIIAHAGIWQKCAFQLREVISGSAKATEGDAADPLDACGYDRGLETVDAQDGWLVITGKEGDTFNPVAFFFGRERAEQYCELKTDDGCGGLDPVAFDACAIEASIVRDRIVCANDFTLDTHEKLRERIAETLSLTDGERPSYEAIRAAAEIRQAECLKLQAQLRDLTSANEALRAENKEFEEKLEKSVSHHLYQKLRNENAQQASEISTLTAANAKQAEVIREREGERESLHLRLKALATGHVVAAGHRADGEGLKWTLAAEAHEEHADEIFDALRSKPSPTSEAKDQPAERTVRVIQSVRPDHPGIEDDAPQPEQPEKTAAQYVCDVIMLSPKDDPLWIAMRAVLIRIVGDDPAPPAEPPLTRIAELLATAARQANDSERADTELYHRHFITLAVENVTRAVSELARKIEEQGRRQD